MAIGKHKQTRRIDRGPRSGQGVPSDAEIAFSAPPAVPTLPVPSGLALSANLTYSAVTPGASVTATWTNLSSYDQESYLLQLALDSGFTQLVGGYVTQPNQSSTTIDGLRTSTTYYGRVAAIVGNYQSDWSASASVTTPADTTPPAQPTGQAATFNAAGDLVVTWTNPTSANFRDVAVYIFNGAGTVELRRAFVAGQLFVYTAAMNLADTSGAGQPSLKVYLAARSWGGIYAASVSVSATKAKPATPSGLTTSWAGDAGAAGLDCLISWAAGADAIAWQITVDGVTRTVAVPYLLYGLDTNRADHSGTPDPVLSISVVGVDGLKQTSASAATATATNAAPAAPTVTLTGGFAILIAQVTSARAADFLAYEYVFKRDTVAQRTLESAASEQQFETGASGDEGSHSWTCSVRQKDVFGQYSTAATSSAVVLDTLTIGYLRSGAFYKDSDANTFSAPASGTLAALKDDNRASGGVTYAA